MSKKMNSATIKDLKRIKHVVAKVKSEPSEINFSKVDKIEDLRVFGIGDASYKADVKSTGGSIILLGSSSGRNCVPIFWKSKTIVKVCHSAKAAETRNVLKVVDDSLYFAAQINQILFDTRGFLPVKIFTDSRPLLESLGSSKQVEERLMRNVIADLKEKLEEGAMESYCWLPTTRMIADALTKESKDMGLLRDIVRENIFTDAQSCDNLVTYTDGEIAIHNKAG